MVKFVTLSVYHWGQLGIGVFFLILIGYFSVSNKWSLTRGVSPISSSEVINWKVILLSDQTGFSNITRISANINQNKSELPVRSINVDEKSIILPKIIVSISTFLGRLDPLEKTIESIFSQTLQPDVIHIHIPTFVKRIHHNVLDNVDKSQVTLLGHLHDKYAHRGVYFHLIEDIDYGPSMKLIGSLQLETNPSSLIVTFDDDCIYDPRTLQQLVVEAIRRPEFTICTSCELVVSRPKATSLSWDEQVWEGECHGWIKGFQGAVYRVSFFKDNSIFEDYPFAPGGCRYHDDVWISGILRQHGVKPWMISSPFKPVLHHERHKTLSINSVGNKAKYQEECIRYFDSFRFDARDSKWRNKYYSRTNRTSSD